MKSNSIFLKRVYTRSLDLYLDQINFFKKVRARIFKKKMIYSKYSRINNFGDLYNIDLVRFFNAELIYVSSPLKSEMALTGSILGDYPRHFSGHILGAGFISKRYNRVGNNWNVKIIRGPLSAKQCGVFSEVEFGDPGILASQIYSSNCKKYYELGIVPHKRDFEIVKSLKLDKTVKIINPRQLPAKVAKEINQCRFIASSSLHGLIFADSFRIPNIHLKFSDNLIGGFHKFEDYYLGMEATPEHLVFTSTLAVEDIVKSCRLRYTGKFLYQRQEKIKIIISSVIHKEKKISSITER